jgi:hypothetical protein
MVMVGCSAMVPSAAVRLQALVKHVTPNIHHTHCSTAPVAGGLPTSVKSDRYEQESAAGRASTASTIIGRLRQDPVTGEVLPSELGRLAAEERVAAAAADYQLAQELRRLREVLAPRPRASPFDCAPRTTEEQVEFFLRNGFCIVPEVVCGEQLQRLQQAWDKAAAPERVRWESAKADVLRSGVQHPSLLPNGTYAYDSGRFYPESTFDLGNLLSKDDVFLEIIDHPKLVPLLSAVVGSGGIDTDHYR